MQAEVPFKHIKPGETSQLLLSQQMSLPVSGQCSHLRSTGFFVAGRCYYLLSFLQVLLWFCSLPVAAFVACQRALGAPDVEHDLGKLLPALGTSSWCSFPIQVSAGAFSWTRSCGARWLFGGSVWR